MKKQALTLLLVATCASAFAQGTLWFANASPQVNAPIFLRENRPDTGLLGPGWIAQLWYGPVGSRYEDLVPHVSVATFATAQVQAGYFYGGARTLDGIPGGSTAVVQVRVWSAAAGPTWTSAISSIWPLGVSSLFSVTLATPPNTPPQLVGLQSFALIPEPSSFAFVGLGAAALMVSRRRK